MAAFLLDEDVNPSAAEIARQLGLDVKSVHEVGRRGLKDAERLAFAAEERRILVTRNRDDFVRLTIARFQTAEPHCGVLIVPHSIPNKHPDRIAHSLKKWSDAWSATEPPSYLIDFLSR
jgi:predicted nuclease of predicted toxin-antitoxin system